MRVYPAIDIKNGKCVRLYQGDFAKETVVNPNPVEQALAFQKQGASYLHIVDLDGALNGEPVNLALIKEIGVKTGLAIQVGGGIRDMRQVAAYLNSGISRVIIGSSAVSSPNLCTRRLASTAKNRDWNRCQKRLCGYKWLARNKRHHFY
ncbi:1-(5-phosphoribosyl)-5-[(5-phosphoribosylamino)methylideneamino] imidazole-4-carboxamide isomerase [Listeria fleischmannii subsp. fleischmannii]|uniref:1-(5-phosphoribosyl)-5-[(5-phosphoribosylamino)me thylideneamino] imidazole-4-carboxamide isomerase n=1 Tax=Listeria fleischmannii subsp. fleischmannii TaxID=1671902 RepID=A0A2X3H2P0_9LIST|nr:1-(5-phosphoribosyl)-5-[(5-phosphoribosylamino)methylideneamino] imidazole-4-carboxamide isomerase [Listeria fleischmannii subsp. fleischmannii]